MVTMSLSASRVLPRKAWGRILLPYLLSLPSLLVTVGIFIPFVTAAIYSLQRYNLAFPAARRFVWLGNYVAFSSDPQFWHMVVVSLAYAILTVASELGFGLAIALLLQRRILIN